MRGGSEGSGGPEVLGKGLVTGRRERRREAYEGVGTVCVGPCHSALISHHILTAVLHRELVERNCCLIITASYVWLILKQLYRQRVTQVWDEY